MEGKFREGIRQPSATGSAVNILQSSQHPRDRVLKSGDQVLTQLVAGGWRRNYGRWVRAVADAAADREMAFVFGGSSAGDCNGTTLCRQHEGGRTLRFQRGWERRDKKFEGQKEAHEGCCRSGRSRGEPVRLIKRTGRGRMTDGSEERGGNKSSSCHGRPPH